MSMVSMAEMLAASGLARLHEKQMASALTRTTEKSIQLKDILDASPVGIGWSDADGNIEYMNHQFTRLFGYTLEDLPTLDVWYQKAYPDPQYRAALITPWLNTVKEAQQTGATPPKLEANVRCKDGSERYVLVSLSWSSGKRLVNFIDISERKQIENELNLREREFRTLVRNLPDIVVRYDCHARFMYVNPKFEESFGFCLNDLYGKRPTQVEGLIEAEFFEQIVLSVAKSCHPIEFEHEVLTADGTSLWGLVHITPELDDNGSVEYVQVLTRDITERRRTEKRLQAHDTMLGMVARGENLSNILEQIVRQVESENKASRCSILLLDVDGKHLLIGAAPSLPAFYNHAIHGLEIGVGVGSCGTAAALGERVVVEDIQTHEYWKNFLKLTEKAGLRACWSEPIIGSTGKVLGTFAIYHTTPTLPDPQQIEQINFAANLAAIAIENSHARTELEQRAYSDYLTGIANRRHFIEQSEIEIKRHNQTPKMITMIMFDIDFFKKINDTYGHNAGDLVLQQIAAVCRNLLPYTALFGRIGGEEFAILLPSSNREQAHAIAEQLRMSIEQTNVTTAEQDVIHFTASFGIVSTSKQVSSVDELLNHADTALYEAKENGRNRVCTAKSVI